MTPEEFEACRLRMGLSCLAMARALNLTPVTIHNYRSGRATIRKCVANAVRWMCELHRLDPANDNLPKDLRKKHERLLEQEPPKVDV